ncbi:MAG: ArnT family glycosyltransferase [Acidobacteriota bacterium]
MNRFRLNGNSCLADDDIQTDGPDIWFWAIILAAFALRIPGLASSELWWDEFLVINRAELPLGMLWDSLKFQSASEAYSDTSPPLHHILAHFSLMLGRNEFFAKLPSVILGSVSVGMAYMAGRDLFGKGAGLASGAILCLSIFHISFSRDMRWYAAFYCFSFMTLWAARNYARTNGQRRQLALTAGLCGMLYSSYIAAPFVAGLFIYLFSASLLGQRDECKNVSVSFFVSNIVIALVVFAIYWPQIEGHIVASKLFQMQVGNFFNGRTLWLSLEQFTHGLTPVPYYHAVTISVLCGIAIVWIVLTRRMSSLLLLLTFTIPQIAAAFLIFVQASVQAKYLVGLLVLFVMLAGAGTQAVTCAVSGLLRIIFGIKLQRTFSVALGACALFILLRDAPVFSSFGDGLKPTTKLVARHMAFSKSDCDSIMYARNRQDKVIYSWYLGDQFRDFRTFQAGPYRRFLFVGGSGMKNASEMPLQKHFDLRGETVQVRRGGIASIAPVPLVSTRNDGVLFEERFDTLSYYRTVWKSENMGIDSQQGTLSLFGFAGPGYSLYRFLPGKAGFPAKVRLKLRVRMEKSLLLPANATLTISVGSDEHATRMVAVLDHSALKDMLASRGEEVYLGTISGDLSFDLPSESLAGENLYLKFNLTPGRYQSSAEIDWFQLESVDPGVESSEDPVWTHLDNLYSNVRVARWNSGYNVPEPGAVYVFSVFGQGGEVRGGGEYLGNEQLQAFRDENPGLPPVLTLFFRDGSPAFLVYDPGLLSGGVSLRRDETVLVTTGADAPSSVKGIFFQGRLDRTMVELGNQQFAIPFIVPSHSVVAVNPGGKGLIRFESVFDADTLDTRDFIPPTNVVKLAGQDCVSCQDAKPCSATYRIASELPITSIRLVYYPRGSVAGDNWVKVSYSFNDTGTFRTFDTYVPKGLHPWVGDMDGRQLRLTFPKPTHIVDLRFDFSGDGMQLWSSSSYPMFIEADVDASSFKEFTLPERAFQVKTHGGGPEPFRMWWSPIPLTFHERWAR